MSAVVVAKTDDEIADLIDRVRASSDLEVGLVVPASSRALQTPLNVRLLAQFSNQSGRRTSVVTEDPRLQQLARASGLQVYGSVPAFERGIELSGPRSSGSPVGRGTLASAGAPALLLPSSSRPRLLRLRHRRSPRRRTRRPPHGWSPGACSPRCRRPQAQPRMGPPPVPVRRRCGSRDHRHRALHDARSLREDDHHHRRDAAVGEPHHSGQHRARQRPHCPTTCSPEWSQARPPRRLWQLRPERCNVPAVAATAKVVFSTNDPDGFQFSLPSGNEIELSGGGTPVFAVANTTYICIGPNGNAPPAGVCNGGRANATAVVADTQPGALASPVQANTLTDWPSDPCPTPEPPNATDLPGFPYDGCFGSSDHQYHAITVTNPNASTTGANATTTTSASPTDVANWNSEITTEENTLASQIQTVLAGKAGGKKFAVDPGHNGETISYVITPKAFPPAANAAFATTTITVSASAQAAIYDPVAVRNDVIADLDKLVKPGDELAPGKLTTPPCTVTQANVNGTVILACAATDFSQPQVNLEHPQGTAHRAQSRQCPEDHREQHRQGPERARLRMALPALLSPDSRVADRYRRERRRCRVQVTMTSAGDGSGRTRVLGIDVGSVRIGLAVSDETCTLASPVATIPNEFANPVGAHRSRDGRS